MTIAETIKSGFSHSNDWNQFFYECEHHAAGDIDQDYDNGSTQYNFADNSCIVICGSFVSVYNSQN